MQSQAKTVAEYLKTLPEDRRKAIKAIRKAILDNLPKGYEEGMQYGMIGYFVPHKVYPDGYHCDPKQPLPFASLASQKNHMALYLMCIYGIDEQRDWFIKAWKKAGKKLDMGKACIRFKKLEDVPLEVVGQAIKRVPAKKYIEHYESVVKTGSKRPARKKAAAKKTGSKKKAAKKATKKVAKKATAKKTSVRKKAAKKKSAKKTR